MNAGGSIHTGARVLVVDDDPDLLRLLTMRLAATGYLVSTAASAAAAEAQLASERPDVVVSDVRLPDRDGLSLFAEIRRHHPSLPVILLTAHGTIPDAVEAIGKGVFAYLTKPFDSQLLREKIEHALSLSPQLQTTESGDERWRAEIVSRSSAMRELLARAIHRASPRADHPFVAINCGAIPEQLLESELFGHVKGAFTGAASNRDGLFLAAHGGTLFLDEIGDMPLALQVKLLRVLQERAVRPVGATQARAIDVRILSATHRDLDLAMGEGQFREDLYYRLNVVSLYLPPLSARREDIPLLAGHFLTQLARKYGKDVNGFAPEALDALVAAPWPGNVRQLYNVVEQVCALATSPLVPRTLVDRALRVRRMDELSYAEAKARFERNYLIQLLKLTDGNVSDAARLAQRNRTEFYRLLQRYDLVPAMFRTTGDSVGPGRQ